MTTLLIATRNGLYRFTENDAPTAVDGFETGTTTVVAGDGEVAVTADDRLARRTPSGWQSLDAPTTDPTHVAHDGTGWIVGGRDPLAIHTADDATEGEWTTHELPTLPAATRWTDDGGKVVSEAGGRVSDTLRTDEGIAVGVERTGVLVWTGDGWDRRQRGLAEDVHDLHQTEDGWLAATGHGVYRTTDAGRTWLRVDTGQRFQAYTYFHGFAEFDGDVYTSGGKHMPGGWGDSDAEALLFRIGDGRSPLREADTPDPTDYIWTLTGGQRLRVAAATGDLDGRATADGVVFERRNGDWRVVCRVPAPPTSLVVLDG